MLKEAQDRTFFHILTQIEISYEVRIHLNFKGTNALEDLVDFEEDSISKISNKLRRLGGRVPGLNRGAIEGATNPTPPFTFGVNQQVRLIAAFILIRFYETVSRVVVPTNVH